MPRCPVQVLAASLWEVRAGPCPRGRQALARAAGELEGREQSCESVVACVCVCACVLVVLCVFVCMCVCVCLQGALPPCLFSFRIWTLTSGRHHSTLGLAWCHGLNHHLQCQHPILESWFESPLLHFLSSSLFMCLGRQHKMAQVLGSLPPA